MGRRVRPPRLLVATWCAVALTAACESGFSSDPPVQISIVEIGGGVWPDSLSVMDTLTIGVEAFDAQGRSVELLPTSLEWSSSASGTLDVAPLAGSLRALMTARASGPADVTVAVADERFSAAPLQRRVDVAPLSVSFDWDGASGLRAGMDTVELSVLRTDTLVATVRSRQPDLVAFQWQSSDASRLRVDSDPRTDREVVLTGLSNGLAEVVGIVERPGFERQEVRLSVDVATLTVSGSLSGMTMRVGQLHTFAAQIAAVDGGGVAGADVSWVSSSPGVLSVSAASDAVSPAGVAQAQVAALAPGPATVTLTVRDSEAGPLQLDFVVDPYGPDSLLVGESFDLDVIAPGPEAATVQWTTSDAAVVKVVGAPADPSRAKVTGRSTGGARAVARISRGAFPEVEIAFPTVIVPPAITPATWSVDTLNVMTIDSAGITLSSTQPGGPNVPISWRSLNPDIAQVTAGSSGPAVVVTGQAPGTVDLVATIGGGEFEELEYRRTIVVAHHWISVSAGLEHTCALNVVRRVYCWGGNTFGEVGDGSHVRRMSPVPIASSLSFDVVFAGGGRLRSAAPGRGVQAHSCAQLGRQLVCWGSYIAGQLGRSFVCTHNDIFFREQCSLPVPADFVGDTLNPTLAVSAAVSLGGSFTCTSTVSLSSGDLNTANTRCGGTLYAPWTPGTAFGVGPQLMAGDAFQCAAPSPSVWGGPPFYSPVVFCTGLNDFGEVGDGSATLAEDPVKVIGPADPGGIFAPFISVGFTQVADPDLASAGARHACMVGSGFDSGGSGLWCWGSNSHGQLGYPTAQPCPGGGPCSPLAQLVDLSAAGDVAHVGLGGDTSCIVNGAGDLYCWGDGTSGQLGNGSQGTRDAPPTSGVALPVPLRQIDGGERHMCAIDEKGTLYCWGLNTNGQLGVGDLDERFVPTRIREPVR